MTNRVLILFNRVLDTTAEAMSTPWALLLTACAPTAATAVRVLRTSQALDPRLTPDPCRPSGRRRHHVSMRFRAARLAPPPRSFLWYRADQSSHRPTESLSPDDPFRFPTRATAGDTASRSLARPAPLDRGRTSARARTTANAFHALKARWWLTRLRSRAACRQRTWARPRRWPRRHRRGVPHLALCARCAGLPRRPGGPADREPTHDRPDQLIVAAGLAAGSMRPMLRAAPPMTC